MSLKTRVLCIASVVGLGLFINMVLGPVFAGEEVKKENLEPAAVVTPLKYPPPPADPTQLPAPVKKYVKMIADLCNTNDLSKQVPQLKKALNGLDKALPFYYENYSTRRVNSGDLREMHTHLLSGSRVLGGIWEDLNADPENWRVPNTNPEKRFNAASWFLHDRIILYNLPDGAGPEFFSHDWEHQVYKGLYCISHDNPRPPKTSLAKKPDAS